MPTTAFIPYGKTTTIAVTATSQALPVDNPTFCDQYVLTVIGSQPVTLAYGPTAPTAIIPVAGTPQSCVILPADSSQTYTFPRGLSFAVIAAATGSTVYMTPGVGV